MKILIFDAGTLINFGMNGLTSILANLRKTFNGKFIITNDVKSEVKSDIGEIKETMRIDNDRLVLRMDNILNILINKND